VALVRSGKRQREQARAEKQREKEQERERRKQEKANAPPRDPNAEDPDIAGIVPGPQPIPDESETRSLG
jgi:hypothetical protein